MMVILMEEEIVYPDFLKKEDEEIENLIQKHEAERIIREKVVELICR